MAEEKSMDHCYSKVKTPTGVFTFHDEEVYKCKARQICEAKGEVLAPLTKQEDREKLRAGLKLDDDECYEYLYMKGYHIGIEVEVCEGEKIGYTSTGEKVDNFDDFEWFTEDDYKFVDTQFIPVSGFEDDFGITMLANGRTNPGVYESNFVCLKPATDDATPEPLLGGSPLPISPITAFSLACCFAATTVGLAIAFVWQTKRLRKTLKEAESIRNCE